MCFPVYIGLSAVVCKQVANEDKGPECRLGTDTPRPFASVCVGFDFPCHGHTEPSDLDNGATLVRQCP